MKNTKLFITALIIFLLDRISKIIILNKQIIYYPIVKNYISLSPVANTGAAFSILQGQQFLLISISIIALVFFLIYFSKKNINLFLQISWGLLIGGALGNLYDRISYRCVVDFISLECIKFPVFNMADFAITTGAIMLFYYYLIKESNKNA